MDMRTRTVSPTATRLSDTLVDAENDVSPKDISIAAASISRYAAAMASSSCHPRIANSIDDNKASAATIHPNGDTYAIYGLNRCAARYKKRTVIRLRWVV